MEIMDMGFAAVGAITVICWLAARVIRATELPNKWLPVICGGLGGILGPVGMGLIPAFPAADFMSAVAVGIVSGFAATGVHQAAKQLSDK